MAGDGVSRVSHLLEDAQGLRQDAFLDAHLTAGRAAGDAKTRPIEGGLRIELVIGQGDDHLHVALRLHEAAHHAERAEQGAIHAGEHAGNDRVVWAFARGRDVRMLRLEAEIVPAILEGEAPAARHDAGAEAHVVAVDERAGVAVAIDHVEIDRV